MEKEELLKMIQLYKMKLADVEEQSIAYQVVISKLSAEKDALQEQVNNLQFQVHELTNVNEPLSENINPQ